MSNPEPDPKKRASSGRKEDPRITRWLFFSVVLALVPLGVTWIVRRVTHPIGLPELLSNGELLLISAALTGASIGELLGRWTSWPRTEIIAGGACVVLLSLATMCFAGLSAARAAQESINNDVTMYVSVIIYVCAVVAGASCVAISGQ